jgi:hypothetical protein
MAAVAVLAASLVLMRVNVALGAVVGCVAGATLVRTVRVMRSRQSASAMGSAGGWLRAGLDSLIASMIIIGSADLAFLVVYFVAKELAAERISDGPGPYVDWDAVYLAIPSGVAVGFIMRRLVWDRRFLPGDSANNAMQRIRLAAGR